MANRTPLFDLHFRDGAKFVEFAGWELPLHFGSILEEAKGQHLGRSESS